MGPISSGNIFNHYTHLTAWCNGSEMQDPKHQRQSFTINLLLFFVLNELLTIYTICSRKTSDYQKSCFRFGERNSELEIKYTVIMLPAQEPCMYVCTHMRMFVFNEHSSCDIMCIRNKQKCACICIHVGPFLVNAQKSWITPKAVFS